MRIPLLGWAAAVWLGLSLGVAGGSAAESAGPLEVKVVALNFDPVIPQEGGKRLHEVCGWKDPRQLAEGYVKDVAEASHGYVHYRIVEWRDVDTFHTKIDGFRYTPEQYMECHRSGKGWHQPDTADYPKTFQDQGLIPRLDRGEVDEVWFFGGPYFGYNESAMAGPGAFYINGAVYDQVKSQRAFAIMGFNYERGEAEMIHDLGHRTESTLARVYGGWSMEKLEHNWARFAANGWQSQGQSGVGSCHVPANGESQYDYANPREVESSADDWLNYPDLKGRVAMVSRQNWGGPDYQRNYLKWFFGRLPHRPGWNADGRLNNWWEYVFRFNAYDAAGRRKAGAP